MRTLGTTLAAAGLAACMPVEERIPTREGSGAACNEAAVQHMVGQIGTGALGAEALRLSGARALRWLAPDVIVTMEYRTDRLNMHHDARNRITRINCG